MWIPVVSFENSWLEENGLYSSKTNSLDFELLKNHARKSIQTLLKSEGMLNNSDWVASIHTNREHFHVHFAIVQKEPMRSKIGNKEYDYQRGKFKLSSIEKAKSSFANDIMRENINEERTKLNKILRDNIVSAEKERKDISKDHYADFIFLHKKIKELGIKKNMWVYNNNKIKSLHEDIDTLSKKILINNYSDEHKNLMKTAKNIDIKQAQAYGSSAIGKCVDSTEKDLNYRLGNAILTQIKNFDTLQNKKKGKNNRKVKTIKRFSKKTIRSISNFSKAVVYSKANINYSRKYEREIDYAIRKVFYETEDELKQQARNLRKYEERQREQESYTR